MLRKLFLIYKFTKFWFLYSYKNVSIPQFQINTWILIFNFYTCSNNCTCKFVLILFINASSIVVTLLRYHQNQINRTGKISLFYIINTSTLRTYITTHSFRYTKDRFVDSTYLTWNYLVMVAHYLYNMSWGLVYSSLLHYQSYFVVILFKNTIK